ncbi:MAG: hypothetical protein AAF293_15705 [Pseudomonadota bacterium]
MSDTDNRKSMDDVLASIRRIVRAEKDPVSTQEADPVAETGFETPPEPETEAIEPLALTPEMRMTPDVNVPDVPSDLDETPLGSTTAAVADVVPSVADALDPDQIREMVREVVMEQLGGADAGEMIRSVIRDELTTGEIGGNISQNVMRLIQAEVGKALGK